MKRNALLMLLLALTLSGDTLFSTSLIWIVAGIGGSKIALGFFLCITTLIPYAAQKFSGKVNRALRTRPVQVFSLVRTVGIGFSFLGAVLANSITIWLVYLLGIVFMVTSYLSNQILESIMSMNVIEQKISANTASRLLQTAVQAGAFIGSSAAGFLLDLGGLRIICLASALTFGIGALALRWLDPKDGKTPYSKKSEEKNGEQRPLQASHSLLWSGLVALIVLTMQVAAFNFLIPTIARGERAWTARDFGLIDALAGIGAFAAVGIGKKSRIEGFWKVSFLAVGCLDVLVSQISSAPFVAGFAFLLGFFFNLLRIRQREMLYNSMRTSTEAVEWAGRITLGTMGMKALFPLLLGFVVSVIPSSMVFAAVGVFLAVILGLLQIPQFLMYQDRQG